MSSLRNDPRTSAAVRGSGWVANSPQADQLLARLEPNERVELLFTTLRFQGALTGRRLLLWRGTFKVAHMELSRPLTLIEGRGPSRFGEAVVLDGSEGAIELNSLSPAVARALVSAGRRRNGNVSGAPPHVAQHDHELFGMTGPGRGAPGQAPAPPYAEGSASSPEGRCHTGSIRTWQDAELAAADHMRSLGFTDARVTGAGADGGIDVVARDAVAQVKHYSQPIGVGPIRELRGVADSHHHLLFYASGGYTASARQFADERKVALFTILELGDITPLNPAAVRLSARPAPSAGWSRTISSPDQAASGRGWTPTARASQRSAELDAQRQTVLRLITRVRARTSEVHALPSNRCTKDLIKALKAAHKLTERADSLLVKSQADFQTYGTRKRFIAMADEKAREAALKLGMRT
ncbi:restriction endonuclease [Streptomyces sp. NBC_01460]|uniref:restriction endonuclease n=1 Tax=Streptomyces sp. NBC_01460 TaxID=2903875 RepID=UPI002E331636|nr:restriction endonuclease [Streptomyces sp. NBC_01460]